MPAPAARMRSASVPCGTSSSSSSPARYSPSNTQESAWRGNEQMILRTRRALSRAATPSSALPALLFTTVRSRAPCAIRASISSPGTPTPPKPPISTVAPSKMSATAASRLSTVRSIKGLSPDVLPKLGSIAATSSVLVGEVPAVAAQALDLHGRLDEVGAGGLEAAGEHGERRLVVEFRGPVAGLADQGARMVALRLVGSGAARHEAVERVDPVHRALLDEELERPVDRGGGHPAAALLEVVLQVVGLGAAVPAQQQLVDLRALGREMRAALAAVRLGMGDPGRDLPFGGPRVGPPRATGGACRAAHLRPSVAPGAGRVPSGALAGRSRSARAQRPARSAGPSAGRSRDR